MKTIKEILVERDGMTPEEADDLIDQAREDFDERIIEGEDVYNHCEEWFGLEPDFLMEFM